MFAIAPTDKEWFDYLKDNLSTDRINFWTPTPWNIKKLDKGDKLYFLLKAPYRKIGGFGYFEEYKNMSTKEAWFDFGKGNGVNSLAELVERCTKYIDKNSTLIPTSNPTIGCIVLKDPVFLDEEEFLAPVDIGLSFPSQVVKLKYFHESDIDILDSKNSSEAQPFNLVRSKEKKYRTTQSKERKGQSNFRKRVLEAYNHRCCITGEECLDILEAAHIQEYIDEESNHVQNGLLLRTDLHRLFDAGLISLSEDYRVTLSPILESEYYKNFNGKHIDLPLKKDYLPSISALRLHHQIVFRDKN